MNQRNLRFFQQSMTIIGMIVMGLLAFVSLLWPFCRIFWGIPITTNEGWNAFYADAAMGRGQLYPSLDQLITNNYPPLSFYVVGFLGKTIGNPILAGRFISFSAVLVLALLIGRMIQQWSRDFKISSAVIGASYFAATMSCFFNTYVGMNDPQLLAEVIMVVGFSFFLRAYALDRGYAGAILMMVIAGFFKHNIITFPLVAIFLLVRTGRWRRFVESCCYACLFLFIGFLLCYFCYGLDFFHNLLAPRCFQFSNLKQPSSWHVFYVFRAMYVGLLLWIFIRWCYRATPHQQLRWAMQLIDSIIVIGLAVHVWQRFGDGVWSNSGFDLLIGVSLAVGLSWGCLLNFSKKFKGALILSMLVLALLCNCLLKAPRFHSPYFLISPAFHQEIIRRQQYITQKIDEVRSLPGDVFFEPSIVWYAGKPFVVDQFSVEQRIKAGKIPKDVIEQRVNNHTLIMMPWESRKLFLE